jgi:tetratricopeptide (TPR) repeat protein
MMPGRNARPFAQFLMVYGVICIAVILVYYPGLHGPFVFDDIPNILRNPAIRISDLNPSSLYAAAAYSPSNAMSRPLAGISFAINYYIAGNLSSAVGFKLTNLIIHLVNSALVYWFVKLLVRQTQKRNPTLSYVPWLPGLATAIWALHPINLTSVLYVVQRMTSLSALFVLLGMILFLYGRQRIQEQKDHGMTLIVAGWFTGLLLGMGGKETAVLMLLYIPLVEYLIFSRADFHTTAGKYLSVFYALGIGLPLLLLLGWVLTHTEFLFHSYDIRDFGMAKRLLTEPRIIWFYLYLLFIPNIAAFGLYHDDIPVSTGAFTPWTTLPAIFAIIVLIVTALLSRKKYPLFSFAILWFLVGHALESTFLPLELAHEHRNYLPAVGPVVGITYALGIAFHHRNRFYPVLCGVIAIVLASVSFVRAQTWATEDSLITTMGRNHPASPRTQAILAEYYAYRLGNLAEAQRHYELAATLEPDDISYTIRVLINAARISAPKNNGNDKPDTGAQAQFAETAISPQLRDRLEEHLSNKPLTPSLLFTLDQLATCFLQSPSECGGLYPQVIDWYLWALNNPRISRDAHKTISIYLFRISTAQKNYSTALDAAINARSVNPADISLLLMEADARIALHQFGRAEDMLLHAGNGSVTLPPDGVRGINILLAKIRAMRASSMSR